jgi:hypothetical protein
MYSLYSLLLLNYHLLTSKIKYFYNFYSILYLFITFISHYSSYILLLHYFLHILLSIYFFYISTTISHIFYASLTTFWSYDLISIFKSHISLSLTILLYFFFVLPQKTINTTPFLLLCNLYNFLLIPIKFSYCTT